MFRRLKQLTNIKQAKNQLETGENKPQRDENQHETDENKPQRRKST
jgi:hypothetical protein